MVTRCLLSVLVLLCCSVHSFAQVPWQFQWKKGLTLNYKIKLSTSVVEVVESKTYTSSSKLDLVNRWDVSDLDDKGVATLEMSITSMRQEQTLTSGEVLLFDSENPAKSTPELVKQMSKFVGKTSAIVRMDQFGRVLDVKQGSAKTFEVEPPFVVVFPDAKAAAGQAWRRQFTFVVDPPYGTGEKFDAEQRYECKKLDAGKATLNVATTFKTMPDNASERIPLMQKDVQGELVFDLDAGKLVSVQLTTDKTIENHQGKGSSYQFKSQYSRQLVD